LVSCLVMTGAAALFSLNVRNIVDEVEKTNETTVYILKDRSELEAKQIGTQLVAIANVEGVTFISKHVAVEQFKDTLGEQLFNMIKDRDPLNDTYRVSFKDLTKYDETVNQIRQIDGVQSVTDRRSFAHKLATVSSLVNWVSFGIVAALIVVSLFIIANTIRTTMYSRRFEISIMKSVGATNMFVRMPFLVEGMVIGFISAAIATGVLALLYHAGVGVIERIGLGIQAIQFTSILLPMVLAFIAVGVLVGFFGGFISIRKYLKKEGNEILGW
ncbi:MAG: permease-like cell division protein FtsX, partial [Ruminococcus sp.]|nr:permease-like cell division protein FtsX [Ruminococcus sp.]